MSEVYYFLDGDSKIIAKSCGANYYQHAFNGIVFICSLYAFHFLVLNLIQIQIFFVLHCSPFLKFITEFIGTNITRPLLDSKVIHFTEIQNKTGSEDFSTKCCCLLFIYSFMCLNRKSFV